MTRLAAAAAAAVILAVAAVTAVAAPAAAHVVPSTVIALDMHATDATADLTLPAEDLAIASGLDVAEGATLDAELAVEVASYLTDHFSISSPSGRWQVAIGNVDVIQTEQWGTGSFAAVTATATLTPADPAELRTFTLDYDAILHEVATADVYVVLHSDWAAGEPESARPLGTISLDTVTGAVAPLAVTLDAGSAGQGFVGMVRLGVSHIAEGTDHQLFLLTLLLPAPLLASAVGRRRWVGVVPLRTAVRRITGITIAFTIGHSITLAAGAFGLPAAPQAIEALIAVSILFAAAHAIRPLFPGREALVAGAFGLVHGMAFSATLTDLDLSGGELVLSLLGFNLGIEMMQLAVVALVLPPVVVLARSPVSRPLRIGAASFTGLLAVGWLLDRIGFATPLGVAANAVGPVTPWLLAALWVGAGIETLRSARAAPRLRREPRHPQVSSAPGSAR